MPTECSDLALDKRVHWASDATAATATATATVVQDAKGLKGYQQPIAAVSCLALPILHKRPIDALKLSTSTPTTTTMISAGRSKLRRMSKTIKSKVGASVPFGDKRNRRDDDDDGGGMMFTFSHTNCSYQVVQSTPDGDFLQTDVKDVDMHAPPSSTTSTLQGDNANTRKGSDETSSGAGVSATNATATATIFQERQQRQLVLLRHATRCAHPPGSCPVTRHCAEAKILCEHISKCRRKSKRGCPFPHCVSSRYLLSHYKRCAGTDESVDSVPSCSVCGPVRAAIIRSRNKVEEEMARDLEVNLSEVNL